MPLSGFRGVRRQGRLRIMIPAGLFSHASLAANFITFLFFA